MWIILTSWVSEEDWCKGMFEGECVGIGGKEEILVLMKMIFVPSINIKK